jgi:multimeric flavodoxin WrbA
MKLMAIIGSPRRNGNTEALADTVIEGYLSKTLTEVEKIFVTEKKIAYCTGCLSCTFPPPGTKRCVIKDDMADILERMAGSDAFVFATPNHMRTVSAPLLTFLSRMLPIMQFLPDTDPEGRIIGGGFTSALKDKKAAIVISQGDPIFSSALVHAVLERNLMDFGLRRVGDVISSGNMMPGDASKKQGDLERAFQLGVALFTMAGMW